MSTSQFGMLLLVVKPWNAFREIGNIHDPSAVAIRKSGSIVGHIARVISAVCSKFYMAWRFNFCRVTGSMHYSTDLPQGTMRVDIWNKQC